MAVAFIVAAMVSLGTSWVLVSRLERVGARFGLSEALLGVLAALAADAPEITAAVTALVGHHSRIGAGVVIGSNVFNLAALLGFAAVVAGEIALHRRVIVLEGVVALSVAAVCVAIVVGVFSPAVGLVVVVAVLVPYLLVLGVRHDRLRRMGLPATWYFGLAAFALACAYIARGLRRGHGVLIICAYLAFSGVLLAIAYSSGVGLLLRVSVPAVIGIAVAARLLRNSRGRTRARAGAEGNKADGEQAFGEATAAITPPACASPRPTRSSDATRSSSGS